MASKHVKKVSSRAPIARRLTRGPLDDDDLLTLATTSDSLEIQSGLTSPLSTSPGLPHSRSSASPAVPLSPSTFHNTAGQITHQEKDLSFLLNPSIYQPLSQLEIPPPFRQPQPPPVAADTPLSTLLGQLDSLLGNGSFLPAAQLSTSILTSPSIKPTDSSTIFDLLTVRFSCLELTGNTLLAAQEAKALEDLSSEFYYVNPPSANAVSSKLSRIPPLQQNIIPFSLRLQALRLQSIGFSDPRRGISALYELGLECRDNLASPYTSAQDRELWEIRLREIGVRVVNSLIDMGDLDCARRTLISLTPVESTDDIEWLSRMVLLLLKIGDLSNARRLIERMDSESVDNLLEPLLAIAEGRYLDAVDAWNQSIRKSPQSPVIPLLKQNLAVAYLYTGDIDKARSLMEELVSDDGAFQSLTFNLATLYELTSDKSKELKMALAGRVAKQQGGADKGWVRTNMDFKL